MSRYLIVIERTTTGYSAWSPDLPGCTATGATPADVEANMAEAMAFHVDGLRENGDPVPPPASTAAYVEVAA
jgi:predicted RNase H-like HicB family nuclease